MFHVLRVLIADDHAVVRHGVREILRQQLKGVRFGEAQNAQEVLDQVSRGQWDVLILDIKMPGASGMDLLAEVKRLRPELPVLVLSMYSEQQFGKQALRAGAAGYLSKECGADELAGAVLKVSQGGKYISRGLAERLAFDVAEDVAGQPHQKLSSREYQTMCMIASGKTVSQIAEELSLSVKTVSTYRARALTKMGMKTNAELTRYAIENGLVE